MRLALQDAQVRELATRLGLVMTLADLVGRARVVEEARGDGVDVALDPTPAFADVAAQILPFTSIEPEAAMEIFRQKYAVTREAFDKMAKRYRASAFTIARVESVALIEKVQLEVDRAIAQGLTQQQFAANADQVLRAAGVTLDPFHIETVFRTNVLSAYGAGRLSQQLRTKKALPIWEYVTVQDSRVRDEHAALHGFLARWDDPVWKRIYPPNGYNCRCGVRVHSEAAGKRLAYERRQDLDKQGLTRLPAGVKIDFDRWPLADPGAAVVQSAAATGERSAQEITAGALEIKRGATKQLAPLRKELEAVEPQYLREILAGSDDAKKTAAKVRTLREEIDQVRRAATERIHALVRVRRPQRWEAAIGSRIDAKRRSTWEAGVREFARLVSDLVRVAESDLNVTFRSGSGRRSHYDVSARAVVMAPRAGVRIVVHELGHALEARNPGVARKARAFLLERAGDETLQRLAALTGKPYGPKEVAYKDRFLDAYMGKWYGSGPHSEIVSMGLEWLYADPLRLLDDPEYFGFIVGLLRGE
ncbi:MAG: hypothetical protein GC160_02885 [Acidobacteria bacterium]|nr:hypothetical protein [Acidobacteriota bacterium]